LVSVPVMTGDKSEDTEVHRQFEALTAGMALDDPRRLTNSLSMIGVREASHRPNEHGLDGNLPPRARQAACFQLTTERFMAFT